MYSSAARVPYDAPHRFILSAPNCARIASKSRTAIQVAYWRKSAGSAFKHGPSRAICCSGSSADVSEVSSTSRESVQAAGATLIDEDQIAPRV